LTVPLGTTEHAGSWHLAGERLDVLHCRWRFLSPGEILRRIGIDLSVI